MTADGSPRVTPQDNTPARTERYTLTDAERAVIVRHEARLVCSWCGEDFDGDPENAGSDCCMCDLVSASSLPSIIQDARKENADLIAEWCAEEEAVPRDC